MRFHKNGSSPENIKTVFVFGSNQKGYHGLGAAEYAHKNLGYPLNLFRGLYGCNKGIAYAIPTKDIFLRPLLINKIKDEIEQFVEFANTHDHLNFFLTAVACGYSRYKNSDIAPLFNNLNKTNISFPDIWKPFINESEPHARY